MSTFKVELTREVTTTETKTISIEATSPEDARAQAERIIAEGSDDGEGWKENVDLADFGDTRIEKVTLAAFDDADANPVE